MIEPKHTPTPWTIESTPSRIEVRTDPMHVYAFSHADRGNAEFIVRAVNAHDALVSALERALRECDEKRWPAGASFGGQYREFEVVQAMRAALRAAKEEQ